MRQLDQDARTYDTALWPPDDTEESVVGSEYHQLVIDAIRDCLRMAALANRASWHVQSQVTLSGFVRPNGSPYSTLPDVFVHPYPNPHPESGQALTFAEIGVPLLAVEVLSETTHRHDLDEGRGKAWSYADGGVQSYIIVDPTGLYLPERVRALRLAGRRWVPWPRTPEGRWVSGALGVSFAFDDPYLRVYDAAGRLMPLPLEAYHQMAEREARLHEQERLVARLRALAQRGDLDALRAILAEQSP